jgi:hypothetical protein
MKSMGLSVLLLLASAGALSAQVSVEVLLGQEQFLPGEALPVKVRLVNNSGQTIRFGKEDWLSYSVEGRDGIIVMRTGEAPQPHDFSIKAAEMATTHADLSPYFNISKPGRYAVAVTVHIKDWDKEVTSAEKHFDIVQGARFWEQEFGVPQPADVHTPPEVRKYILQQATLARQMKLYLRVTDASESKTLRIFPIGPMISFSDPQMRVDRLSNLHLLFQEGAHVYNYSVFNPDGAVTLRQTYHYSTSAPRLKGDEAGNAIIVGGVRHLADTDFPPTRKSFVTNDIPPPVP